MMQEAVSLAQRYKKLESRRNPVLERARECAKLTIPSIQPPDSFDEQTALYKPYQSQGARGVNNLASKLMMTLLPPNAPFFRFTLDPALIAEAGGDMAQVENTLAEMENILQQSIETSGERLQIYQMLRLLITTGNALLYFPDIDGNATLKVYRLDQYVVLRDPLGNLLELLIKEQIAPMAINNEAIRSKILSQKDENKTYVDLYTRAVFDDKANKWLVTQEINGIEISESSGEFEANELPYLALRWSALPNEDYGRSYVDEVIGDLRSLEGLSQARQEATAAAAKVLIFCDPNGTTSPNDIAKADNLEVITGRATEVTAFQLNKGMDLNAVRENINDLKQDLAYHFLLNSSIQRQAERVTAEEIRTMAGELEASLGGTYTVLSQEFQLPYIRLKVQRLRDNGVFPEGSEAIEPIITTGLDGLGRGAEMDKLMSFIQGAVGLGGQAISMLNFSYILSQMAVSSGIKPNEILISPEQMQQNHEQAQMEQLGQSVAPEIAKGAINGLNNMSPEDMQGMAQAIGNIPPEAMQGMM
ncbi:phage tail protein [Campylobacter hyointestinalis subsp. hyointestinalis]|uniref:portal protein n=2 Tax=Campylobacter hyointestinalis TaxID=198 RepID=UPI0007255DA5|nr:portal protein [Campylobacter hyointestinalis]PPB51703.1 phage tail protein [Campylobacter hyointestinalis subsp. hyointestinalis]PPB55982.1 phage tail protein [Campylobacter hyointestinalis subsp. hyointestinalis]PPB61443.1 phage tail protein [Campylobacter hyointestinalis subsp. hyointestinalis]CUU87614.1 Bacteriophage head to tail connecting protein [Campylobacter hyointestinalis subsp. hyointestinalis]